MIIRSARSAATSRRRRKAVSGRRGPQLSRFTVRVALVMTPLAGLTGPPIGRFVACSSVGAAEKPHTPCLLQALVRLVGRRCVLSHAPTGAPPSAQANPGPEEKRQRNTKQRNPCPFHDYLPPRVEEGSHKGQHGEERYSCPEIILPCCGRSPTPHPAIMSASNAERMGSGTP